MTKYEDSNLINQNNENECSEFHRLFKGKYSNLIGENGKIISVETSDINANNYLISKGKTAK